MEQESRKLRLALVKLAKLGKDLLQEEILGKSPLYQRGNSDEHDKQEKLRFKEIISVENVIRLLTGREFSLQWQKNPDGDVKGGFALYEIMEDAPCITFLYRDDVNRRLDWGKGLAQGKIVKIYELVFDKNAKQHYVGGFLSPEFKSHEP